VNITGVEPLLSLVDTATGNVIGLENESDASGVAVLNIFNQSVSGTVRVGIFAAFPDATLTVNGTADKPGGGSWGTFSDERLKDIKGHFDRGLKELMQIDPIRYEYKQNNALGLQSEGEHIGLGAQSVENVIPEAVHKNDKGYRILDNDPILWTMLNAIKEQQQLIEKQQSELDALRAELRSKQSPR